MKSWKRIEPTNVTKVGWRTITAKTFELPDGRTEQFFTMHPDGQEFVNILALTADNQVVVARQFRPGPEIVCDDLPGGFVDPGESPEQAVIRELKEETGYVPGKIRLLGSYHKDTYMNAVWYGFLATDCRKETDPVPEDTEDIEVDIISIGQLMKNAKSGKMTDQQTVLMAYDTLKEMEA
jgi:ADP-ribose pyrophosphatase